jgi:two-component system alkaline phosphatase synthesis response regulator PhoP
VNQFTVLVVDDEPKIREILRGYLEADAFAVLEAASGPEALRLAETARPDLVVLDLMLPGLNGIDVLTRLHRNSDVPVILLTARVEETDKLIGLSAGADDYLTKPFSGRELVAHVRAVLRRSERSARPPDGQPEPPLRVGGLEIDPSRRHVIGPQGPVALTALDFDLLLALARDAGHVLTRRQLLHAAWGEDYYGDERVVDVHIRTLRKALGDDANDPSLIGTVRSIGYRFLTESH